MVFISFLEIFEFILIKKIFNPELEDSKSFSNTKGLTGPSKSEADPPIFIQKRFVPRACCPQLWCFHICSLVSSSIFPVTPCS